MEKVDLKDYIFAQEQNREALTINRFFADRLSFLGLWFARTLKWELPYVWLGFRIPHERLLKGFECPPNRFSRSATCRCVPSCRRETSRVDGAEANLVTRQSNAGRKLTHFGDVEDDGQLLFGRRAHDVKRGPLFLQCVLKEKLESTDGDGHGVAGVMFDILDEEKVLAQFFLADQVRRLVIMFGQLPHCALKFSDDPAFGIRHLALGIREIHCRRVDNHH